MTTSPTPQSAHAAFAGAVSPATQWDAAVAAALNEPSAKDLARFIAADARHRAAFEAFCESLRRTLPAPASLIPVAWWCDFGDDYVCLSRKTQDAQEWAASGNTVKALAFIGAEDVAEQDAGPDALSLLAECRDRVVALAPDVEDGLQMCAVGGPDEVPTYIEAVIRALLDDAAKSRALHQECAAQLAAAQVAAAARDPSSSPWTPLSASRLNHLEGKYWVATKDKLVLPGTYEWRQGSNPHHFRTEQAGLLPASRVLHIMPYSEPGHPDTLASARAANLKTAFGLSAEDARDTIARLDAQRAEQGPAMGFLILMEVTTVEAVCAAAAPTMAQGDWRQPTRFLQRFGDAMQLLCGGHRPSDEALQDWLNKGSDGQQLQEFACQHGPSWAQGIGLIDAAIVAADQPTEILTLDAPQIDHERREL